MPPGFTCALIPSTIHYGLTQVPESTVFYPGKLYRGWTTVNMDPEFVKQNPQTTRKVIRALIKAQAYVGAHKDECIALVAARLRLDEKALRALWGENEFKVELDKGLLSDMQEIGAWSKDLSKSDKPLPNFREYIDERALRAERPNSVSF